MKLYSLKLAAMILLFASISCYVYAQNNGKITGNVIDNNTRGAVSFVSVSLMDQITKANVRSTQTDINGNFVLDNLPVGVFSLRLSFVGYTPVTKDSIVLDKNNSVLSLRDMQMNVSRNQMLKEVTVTANRATLQNQDGKKVFAVNQSLVSRGGNAADLLKNVPTLQIDDSGNVSLRGSNRVKVLVDGKPSVIANGNIAQVLQSIPANSIESIEVIPNPPAKYDANGEGIINIILKKNTSPGLNGSVAIGVGTRDNYNADAGLSYQNSKVNLYGNYSLKNENTYSTGVQYLTFLKPTDSVGYSKETFPSVTRNKIQLFKAGIDYSFAPGSTLGISGSFNLRDAHRNEGLTFNDFAPDGTLIRSYNRYNTSDNNGNSHEFDLDYRQRFKKPKEELTFNFAYAHGSSSDYGQYKTHFNSIHGEQAPVIDTPLISDVRNNITNYNIQADYVLPIGKAGQFSAGYRSQITLGKNDQYAYRVFAAGNAPFYAFTSFFSSNNQVHAVYLNYRDRVANFSYEVGLRGEDSHLNGALIDYNTGNSIITAPVKVPDKGLYPSVLLTEKLENNSRLQFSYANRVLRPTGRQINSTTDFSDPENYYKGNPGLIPENIYNLELDYSKTWQNISLTSGIYHNRVNNVLQNIQTEPVNDETTTTPENLGRQTTTGLELIGRFDVVKGWDLTANANIFARHNDAVPQFGIAADNGLSWNANVTSNVTLLERLSFQIHADYRAPYLNVQDKNRAVFGLDAAAKYDFAGSRASLSFNANDIFNSRRGAFLRRSDALLLDWERHTVSSRATLSFSYRFGSAASKQSGKKIETSHSPTGE